VQLDDIFPDVSSAPETGKTFLRHALRVWARENGVADDQMAGVVRNILDFAVDTLRSDVRQQGFSA
jgi:hypothetical protein